MRKLLILTAGVALLSAPAFAQTAPGSTSGDQPPTGAASQPAPDQGAATTGATGQPSDVQPGTTAPNGAATPGSNVAGQPSSGPGDVSAGAQPAQPTYAAPPPGTTGATNPPATTSGTRLYTSTTETGVQVISNGPVPDTKATRSKFPPLSRAGRRTKAAGN